MLVAAPGMKVPAAAPVEPPAAAEVSEEPPKPVTGGRVDVVAVPEPVAEAVDAEELNEALPKKGV